MIIMQNNVYNTTQIISHIPVVQIRILNSMTGVRTLRASVRIRILNSMTGVRNSYLHKQRAYSISLLNEYFA